MNGTGVTGSAERRQARRYRIQSPGGFEDGTGTTGNMSTSGVLFETDRELAQGAPIRFLVTLGEHGAALGVRCQGTVVRAERRGARWAVAVRIASVRFERLG
jgi:hypothetical protein